jgi:putative acetyltransferase
MIVRPVLVENAAAIHDIVAAAFGRADEADLVERLRASGDVLFELIVVDGKAVVGHVLFSRIRADRQVSLAALAPLAVAPSHQGRGLGANLTRAALDQARTLGLDAVLVLGDADYYRRFGFSAAAASQVASPFAGKASFMGLELTPGALNDPVTATYSAAFRL